jgi:hypothetical protein
MKALIIFWSIFLSIMSFLIGIQLGCELEKEHCIEINKAHEQYIKDYIELKTYELTIIKTNK